MLTLGLSILLVQCSSAEKQSAMEGKDINPYYSRTDTTHLNVSDEEWKKILSKEVYNIAREKGTEWAFTGKYYKTDVKGDYYCAVCGNHLFKSDSKFASSCGWPSFFEAIRPNSVNYIEDRSHGMVRTEVTCGRCDSHLGHIFDDGSTSSNSACASSSGVGNASNNAGVTIFTRLSVHCAESITATISW